jgi:hypothetical protein
LEEEEDDAVSVTSSDGPERVKEISPETESFSTTDEMKWEEVPSWPSIDNEGDGERGVSLEEAEC